jgi:hypothetical protein
MFFLVLELLKRRFEKRSKNKINIYPQSLLDNSLKHKIPKYDIFFSYVSVGCTKFMFEGKGDFRVQKKIYQAQNSKHYIESLRLIKRTSFYKCEPKAEKYGRCFLYRTVW